MLNKVTRRGTADIIVQHWATGLLHDTLSCVHVSTMSTQVVRFFRLIESKYCPVKVITDKTLGIHCSPSMVSCTLADILIVPTADGLHCTQSLFCRYMTLRTWPKWAKTTRLVHTMQLRTLQVQFSNGVSAASMSGAQSSMT